MEGLGSKRIEGVEFNRFRRKECTGTLPKRSRLAFCMGFSPKIWAPIIGYVVFESILDGTLINILFRSRRPIWRVEAKIIEGVDFNSFRRKEFRVEGFGFRVSGCGLRVEG